MGPTQCSVWAMLLPMQTWQHGKLTRIQAVETPSETETSWTPFGPDLPVKYYKGGLPEAFADLEAMGFELVAVAKGEIAMHQRWHQQEWWFKRPTPK